MGNSFNKGQRSGFQAKQKHSSNWNKYIKKRENPIIRSVGKQSESNVFC